MHLPNAFAHDRLGERKIIKAIVRNNYDLEVLHGLAE